MSTAVLCCAGAGLITGNYLYQLFGSQDWALATDRSFFQAWALMTVRALMALDQYREKRRSTS
jgi:hypothetical protein